MHKDWKIFTTLLQSDVSLMYSGQAAGKRRFSFEINLFKRICSVNRPNMKPASCIKRNFIC